MGTTDTAVADQLLTADADWGKPPEKNVALIAPELPELEGWYWMLGDEYAEGLAAGEVNGARMLVAAAGSNLMAFEASSGKLLWTHGPCPGLYSSRPRFGGSRIFLNEGYDVAALEAADGREVWRIAEREIISSTEEGLWLFKGNPIGEAWEWGNPLFEYVDAAKGVVLKSIDPGQLLGAARGHCTGLSTLVVKSGGEFVAYLPDGTERRIAASAADTQAYMLLCSQGFLAAELLDKEYDDLGNESGVALSFVELPEGRLRWRREVQADWLDTRTNDLLLSDEYFVYEGEDQHLHALNLSDGMEVFASAGKARTYLASLSGAQLVFMDGSVGDGCMKYVRLSGGAETSMLDPGLDPELICIDDGWLFVFADKAAASAGAVPVDAIWGLRLTEGQLQAGKLNQLNLRPVEAGLRDRFFAAERPLADAGLMRDLVQAGISTQLEFLAGCGPQDSAHLDALLAAVVYSPDPSAAEWAMYPSSADSFLQALGARLDPSWSPQLIRWLEDTSLKSVHHDLLGLLAGAGGPQAGAWLASFYGDFRAQYFEPVRPPFRSCRMEEYKVSPALNRSREDETLQEQVFLDEVEATDGGKEYTLFSSDFLGYTRDLFLAVSDPAQGGNFQEVLCTGLRDEFYRQGWNPHFGEEIRRQGPIALELDGDRVLVTHHVPVYQTQPYGYGEPGETREVFVDTSYVVSELSMKELRRDTDKDGLPDLLETRLHTDPAQPDSDRDGVSDFNDRLPNVNPSIWGVEERGLARALRYYVENVEPDIDLDSCNSLPPFKARFFNCDGVVPVAIPVGSSYCISVSEPEVSAWNDPGSVSASWDNNAAGYRYAWGSAAYGPEIVALVHIGHVNTGSMVTMVKIDGEYYPRSSGVTSIAD